LFSKCKGPVNRTRRRVGIVEHSRGICNDGIDSSKGDDITTKIYYEKNFRAYYENIGAEYDKNNADEIYVKNNDKKYDEKTDEKYNQKLYEKYVGNDDQDEEIVSFYFYFLNLFNNLSFF